MVNKKSTNFFVGFSVFSLQFLRYCIFVKMTLLNTTFNCRRNILWLSIGLSFVSFMRLSDLSPTECELIDNPDTIEEYPYCLDGAFKNSDEIHALCCTENKTKAEYITVFASFLVPILIAFVDLEMLMEDHEEKQKKNIQSNEQPIAQSESA